jgi:hypothetical protein
MFLHLKKGLDAAPVDWEDCQDPYDESDAARPAERRRVLTSYGVHKDVQQRLAAIRTDLDSFHETEAWALMASGYAQAKSELPKCVSGFPPGTATPPQWRFLPVLQAMNAPVGGTTFGRLLDVARERAFKVWRLDPRLQIAAAGIGLIVLAGMVWLLVRLPSGFYAALFAVAAVVGSLCLVQRVRDWLGKVGVGIGLALFGWLASRAHLRWFDPMYLRRGRWENVQGR